MTIFLGGIVKGIGNAVKGAAKGFIGSGGSPLGAVTGAIGGIAGSGGNRGGGAPSISQPVGRSPLFQQPGPPQRGRPRDIVSTSPVDLGPISVDPGGIVDRIAGDPPGGDGRATKNPPTMSPGSNNGTALGGAFGEALTTQMLSKKVRGRAGRAILEAMQAGSLQGGMIQQPTRVDTPRGPEFHSPPGFRTVTLSGDKISVFKPLAMALNLLPKRTRAKVTAADMKALTEADRLTKKLKRLAKKTGNLKVTNK